MTIEVIIDEQKLTKEDEELIRKILLAAEIKEYNLTNIKYYNFPDTYRKNIFIAFGSNAGFKASKIDSYSTEHIIVFPAISFLYDKESNKAARQQAFNLIEILKNRLKIKEIVEQNIDLEYTVEQLIQISKSFALTTGVTLLNSNGKKIRISFTSEDNILDKKSADINIMFNELIAIKLAMDIFK